MRDFVQLMCAGAWDVIKMKGKGNAGRQPHSNSVDVEADRAVRVVFLPM